MGPFESARRDLDVRHHRAHAVGLLLAALVATLVLVVPAASGAEPLYPPRAGGATRNAEGFQLTGTVYNYGGVGASTKWHFEYGTTSEYTAGLPLPEGEETAAIQPVSVELTGLAPNTTYHWRLVSDNSVEGKGETPDQTFSTAVTTATPPPSGGGSTGGEPGTGLYPGTGSGSPTMPSVVGNRPKRVAKTIRHGGQTLLTTISGRTLYALSAERKGKFVCTAASGCTKIWKPLTVAPGVAPQGPVRLGTIHRPEGTVQVTYRGHPLYTFGADKKPGQVKGEGLKDIGTWHAVVVP